MKHRLSLMLFSMIYGLAMSPARGDEDVSMPPLTLHKPFAVYSGRDKRPNHYIPSGYMGDNDLTMSGAFTPTHEKTGTPLRVRYHPRGSKGWSGIYWQHPANNWGDRPGVTGYDLSGAERLVFWARGEQGGEVIHEVRVGGIVGHYPDSDAVKMGPIKLTTNWQRYEVDLSGKDLRHIIGGFAFSVLKYENDGETTFYLDDIAFEMPQTVALPAVQSSVIESTPVPTGQPVASIVLPLPTPVSPSKEIQIKSEENGLRVSFSTQFLFSVGQTALRPESKRILSQVITILKAYPKNDVLVEGHTDSSGKAEFNLTLSRLRSEHVRDYLINEGGFDPQRFRVVGYGATRPITDNTTREGRALNRRVEVIILKTVEKP